MIEDWTAVKAKVKAWETIHIRSRMTVSGAWCLCEGFWAILFSFSNDSHSAECTSGTEMDTRSMVSNGKLETPLPAASISTVVPLSFT